MYPPNRRQPARYPPARYPIDNSIGGDMGSRYFPERPDDGRYYPTTVTGTRYPVSDNRLLIGNERNPIFILKYGNNRFGSSGMPHDFAVCWLCVFRVFFFFFSRFFIFCCICFVSCFCLMALFWLFCFYVCV